MRLWLCVGVDDCAHAHAHACWVSLAPAILIPLLARLLRLPLIIRLLDIRLLYYLYYYIIGLLDYHIIILLYYYSILFLYSYVTIAFYDRMTLLLSHYTILIYDYNPAIHFPPHTKSYPIRYYPILSYTNTILY